MLGVSAGPMGSSGTAAAGETLESGGASGGSSEVGGPNSIPCGGVMEESERSGGGGGNRWPRQETLALLKIRSDMDGIFRDASLKGPLWEEVSRKMAELGFQRSAKKCKEKFENVYKYHKRTKDGRSSKPDGKSYRFFDQLEAFETTLPNLFTPPPPPLRPPPPAPTAPPYATNIRIPSNITVSSSTSPTLLTIIPPIPNTAPVNPSLQTSKPPLLHPQPAPLINTSFLSNSTSSSSSTSSDEDIEKRRRGRKRKWKHYFERLMRDVVEKQEEMQNKFLDALEKSERDRIAREESWRTQEIARINRERDLLAQERSKTAARDTTMIAFLRKVTNEHNFQIPIIINKDDNHNGNSYNKSATQQAPQSENPQPPPSRSSPPPQQPPAPQDLMITPTKTLELIKMDSHKNNREGNFMQASSSRWPKAEIQALIKLRTSLDIKYQENGPKGPLWEEISTGMSKIGYSRSAKRCKEKWENINKYYKKVKESNRKRPEDSKTCPYFHLLEELYKEKAIIHSSSSGNTGYGMNLESPMAPIMARPEQQWPLSEQQQPQDSLMHDNANNEDYDDEYDEDEDDEEGGGYEVIANKPQPPSSMTNTVE